MLPFTLHAKSVPPVIELQTHTVTGTVSDNSGTLPGVSISIKNSNKGTISGSNGSYAIEAQPNDTLVFSFIGYKTRFIPVNGQKTINITLQEDATQLQEVKVNAGYYSVKEKERTGSIAKVKAADIEKQPVSNPLAAMQGRMSGVSITQTTGNPGGSFNVQVRGINSIRSDGNSPLYIVDGVPFASQSLSNENISVGSLPGTVSPLNSINPSDIESIEVLKDADATAIYGSRGANGVVLITTKKGKAGQTRFNIQTYSSIGKVTRRMDLMNTEQYLAMRAEAFVNDGITTYPDNAYDINGTWDPNSYTDWQEELIGGTAFINNAQASVSGGSETTQFLLNGAYRHETSVYPGDESYKKGSVHGSIRHKSANNRFNLNFSADYSGDKNTLPGLDLTPLAYTLAPNAPALYDANGNLNWENGTFNNPLAYLEGEYLVTTGNLISNAVLSYKLHSNLELKTSLGYNEMRISEKRTIPTTMFNPALELGLDAARLYLNNGNTKSWIIEPQLNWKKIWSQIKLEALIGTTFQQQKTQLLAQAGSGFPGNSMINNIAAASNIEILNNSVTDYKYQAIFGRINVNWKEKYIVNLTGRRDGSSRFGPENRFANFGAIGTAWVFSKEPIFEKISNTLSFGKIRGSYGITGNDQIGDYQYLDTYEVTPNIYNGTTGIQPTRLFNPNFGWETNKKLEMALELGFLRDNILVTAAYFNNKSSNQLVGIPLPGTTGFSSIQSNLGATVQNTGLEIDIRTVNYNRKGFNWNTMLNFTAPKNKLTEFPGLIGSTYENMLVIGQPLSIVKTYHYTGIDPVTGLFTFEDYNGDGQITATDDKKYVADTSVEYYGGLTNQVTYKNWTLDFLFQFVKQQARNYRYSTAMPGTLSNQPLDILDNESHQLYSTGENPDAVDAYMKYIDSDVTISDASFIRLKSLGLSYSVPSGWSKSASAKVYVQGQNLATITNYKGADPETHSFYLPPLRQFTLGVQLEF
ncbi:putative outer membrane protein [Flavobacterium limnosediminis JC2902]|uniref:Putative outer membrane protein n=1 Tax=Flavobacterium limnosediminis JC2902 TaxID=1341181 RepID=V6SRD7_9FLAO|nr:SusC/RagA family TonB-linked outer membrane protein [Flavobacterium limnosediminis]ESU28742.1 putative outer membrane protein [Flavobacterium limnosediminis JC2902]